jgi:DNA helicase-2/ATP-dependent DNA helicase PcrA
MVQNSLLDRLTDAQRAAVTHADGPLLVLAGAGSGKTRVITRRAAYLASTVARPEQVLAITFTNKAAGEMRERIVALGVGRGMWMCTFHSFCARLLREYTRTADLEINPNFSILDDADSRALIRDAIGNCGLKTDNWPPSVAQAAISKAKNRLLTPEAFGEEADDFTSRAAARIYEEYQKLLVAQNGCDFDDLLMRVAMLLAEHESVRAELAERFRYLLIDEYQDTNHAQYMIATRLAQGHRNICATGDPDQSIYAWRGADIRNILDFEADYPEARTIRLEQNFRSSGAILSAASTLIRNNRRRKHKELNTESEWGCSVGVWRCEDERQEAALVGEDIRRYCDAGGQGGDVGIFYRVNALTRVLEDELRRLHLPYQIARGVEFYSRKEIKDVLAYLRATANPADELAVLRAINTPPRGIGSVSIERLRADAQDRGLTIDQAIAGASENHALKSPARKNIGAFARLLAEIRALPRRPVGDLLDLVLEKSGIEAALRSGKTDDTENEALANVYELVTAARQYDQDYPDGTLAEWLHQISLVSDVDGIDSSGGPVTLMTLHSAKGLEFPVVFIVGLEDGLLPHARALRGDDESLEEERRLCFVGMTRAKQRLTLTHVKYRMFRGVTERSVASRFLGELPGEEIERQTFEVQRDRSVAHLGRHNDEDVPVELSDYFPGQRVRHDEYGDGTILALEPRGRSVYIRVRFDEDGPRSFALEHAPLSVLECP